MTAYIVENPMQLTYMICHAETPGKAKAKFLAIKDEFTAEDYTDLRARQLPALNNFPLTRQNVMAVLGQVFEGCDFCEEHIADDTFLKACGCDICQPED